MINRLILLNVTCVALLVAFATVDFIQNEEYTGSAQRQERPRPWRHVIIHSVTVCFLLIFVRSFSERRKVLATRASSKRKFKPLLLLVLIPFIAMCCAVL